MLDETSFTDTCLKCFSNKLCNRVGFYQHGYSIVGVELLPKYYHFGGRIYSAHAVSGS